MASLLEKMAAAKAAHDAKLASGESTTAKPITSVKREEQPNTPGAAITSVKCEELPARSTAEQDPLKKKARLQALEALKNIGYDTDKDDTLKKHLPRLASVLASHQAAHVREEEKSCERREQGCEEEELEEESSDDGRKWQPRAPQVPPPSWGRSGSRAAAHHLGHGAPGAGHGEAAPLVPKAKSRSGTEPLAQVTFKTLWRRRAAEQPRPSTSRSQSPRRSRNRGALE